MNAANIVANTTHRPVPGSISATSASRDSVRVRFDAFELDESNALLLRDGKALALAPRPFGLLCALARQPGSLVTKNTLLDDVWGHQFFSDSVLKTAISEVRTVLEDDAREPRYIETVSRRGYRFIATTMTLPDVMPVPGTDFSGQPVFNRVADGTATPQASFPAIAAIIRPVYATSEEVRYAHELKVRLRASFLGGEEARCP